MTSKTSRDEDAFQGFAANQSNMKITPFKKRRDDGNYFGFVVSLVASLYGLKSM